MIGADPKFSLSYDTERKADVGSHHEWDKGAVKAKAAEGIRRSGMPSVLIYNLATHVSLAAQSQWYATWARQAGPEMQPDKLDEGISAVMTEYSTPFPSANPASRSTPRSSNDKPSQGASLPPYPH
ncbi:hypothetical protein Daesc_009426 [Daldinia eschscholtzii]|uniref:Uncharacterized protein n=1 Tax=Daldinia eschscholtzii TaxID=292717 RepID=A0AAX6MAY2_9PEZI